VTAWYFILRYVKFLGSPPSHCYMKDVNGDTHTCFPVVCTGDRISLVSSPHLSVFQRHYALRGTAALQRPENEPLYIALSVLISFCNRFRSFTTSWRQNPKVHHRNHNSLPLVRILSQLNPLHTSQPVSPRSITIPSMPQSSKWSLPFSLSHKNLVHFS
jgi:hypothetical protein